MACVAALGVFDCREFDPRLGVSVLDAHPPVECGSAAHRRLYPLALPNPSAPPSRAPPHLPHDLRTSTSLATTRVLLAA